jgi:hypothetical protein
MAPSASTPNHSLTSAPPAPQHTLEWLLDALLVAAEEARCPLLPALEQRIRKCSRGPMCFKTVSELYIAAVNIYRAEQQHVPSWLDAVFLKLVD